VNLHLTEIRHGVELDVVTAAGSWSVRLAEVGADLSLIVVDHLSGRSVLAELLERDAG
jgi:hypothetical protein